MEDEVEQEQYQTEDVSCLSEGFEMLMAKIEGLVVKNAELGRQLRDLQAQVRGIIF